MAEINLHLCFNPNLCLLRSQKQAPLWLKWCSGFSLLLSHWLLSVLWPQAPNPSLYSALPLKLAIATHLLWGKETLTIFGFHPSIHFIKSPFSLWALLQVFTCDRRYCMRLLCTFGALCLPFEPLRIRSEVLLLSFSSWHGKQIVGFEDGESDFNTDCIDCRW